MERTRGSLLKEHSLPGPLSQVSSVGSLIFKGFGVCLQENLQEMAPTHPKHQQFLLQKCSNPQPLEIGNQVENPGKPGMFPLSRGAPFFQGLIPHCFLTILLFNNRLFLSGF